MAGKSSKAAKPKAGKPASAGSETDAVAAAQAGAPDLPVDAAGAKVAVTEAHEKATPKDLKGLPPMPDAVSKVIGAQAAGVAVEKGKAQAYKVLERSFIPRTPGSPAVLVEAGETILYDGKAGSNLELVKPVKKAAAEA